MCDCGSMVKINSHHLRTGHTKSCGCYKKDAASLPSGIAGAKEIYRSYRDRCKKTGREFSIQFDQFLELSQKSCFYCGSAPINGHVRNDRNGQFIYNGLDRLDSDVGYLLKNVVPCCKVCNIAKHTMSKSEFLMWIDLVHTHQHSHDDRSKNLISKKLWLELEAA